MISDECEKYSNEVIISILKATEELNHLKDVDTILDKILLEEDRLRFSYVHNDTLFRKDESNAALYEDYAIQVHAGSRARHRRAPTFIIIVVGYYLKMLCARHSEQL